MKKCILIFVLLLTLSGCGGGGGSEPVKPIAAATTPQTIKSFVYNYLGAYEYGNSELLALYNSFPFTETTGSYTHTYPASAQYIASKNIIFSLMNYNNLRYPEIAWYPTISTVRFRVYGNVETKDGIAVYEDWWYMKLTKVSEQWKAVSITEVDSPLY